VFLAGRNVFTSEDEVTDFFVGGCVDVIKIL
jgi:hypothetical protein